MPPPVTVCTDLQRRGEVTPPYGSDPENPCLPRERTDEVIRLYGSRPEKPLLFFPTCTPLPRTVMRGKTREASPKRRQYAKYCNAVLIASPAT